MISVLMISVAPEVPPVRVHRCQLNSATCQCPSVPHISVYQCTSMPQISAHLSCPSVSPIKSVPPINANQPPISAVSQCHLSAVSQCHL
ncbi:unnamed protein product, partial [Staurois parvus]